MTEPRTSEAIRANIEALAEQQRNERAAAEAARAEQQAKASMLPTLSKSERKAWNELGDIAELADRAAGALDTTIANEREALRSAAAREISEELRTMVTQKPDTEAAMRKIAEETRLAVLAIEAEADEYDGKFHDAWSRAYRPGETTAAHLSQHGIIADLDTLTQPRITIDGQDHGRVGFWASGHTLAGAYNDAAGAAAAAEAEANKPSAEEELAALRAKVDEARAAGQWLPQHVIDQAYPPQPEPVFVPSETAKILGSHRDYWGS